MLLLLLTSLSLASAQRLTDAEELAFKDNVEDLCRGRFVRKFIICKTNCLFVNSLSAKNVKSYFDKDLLLSSSGSADLDSALFKLIFSD